MLLKTKNTTKGRQFISQLKKDTAAGIAAEAKYAADSALEDVQQAFEDLQKNSKGSGEGTVWWMGRQLQDMKKYMSGKAFRALQRKTEKKMAKMKV